MATNTPWGLSQDAVKIERGLTFHSTARHGGFLVSEGYAEKYLSEAARKRGMEWGNYYAFEEDCLASIILLEIPNSRRLFTTPVTWESIIKSLSRWSADYLLERHFVPFEAEYSEWLLKQEDARLRREKSPNLIVWAIGVNDAVVRVGTADGSEHLVTSESYRQRNGLPLLSNCETARV